MSRVRRGVPVGYTAAEILRDAGYSVIRGQGDQSADLVAWTDRVIWFIRAVRSRRQIRNAGDVSDIFAGDLRTLRGLPRPPGASVHLWVFDGPIRSWRFYDVYPGGIAEGEGVATCR